MATANPRTPRPRTANHDPAIAGADLVRWAANNQDQEPVTDLLAREEPLEIRVGGRSVAVTMRTPGHDAELAAGFLLTEGLIRDRKDLLNVVHCPHGNSSHPGNRMNVFLAPHVALDFARLTRHVFASSSCGLCGKSSIESIQQAFPPVTARFKLAPAILTGLPDRMRDAQAGFQLTGGLHGAALFDPRGRLITLHEDVGRHNAVDKAIGHAFLEGRWPLNRHLLLVSGRASFEIMQKALAARIPFVCAVSAPSTLAVDFARASGQTLVGFLRDFTFNIYSRPDRVRMHTGPGAYTQRAMPPAAPMPFIRPRPKRAQKQRLTRAAEAPNRSGART
jgi:FdhD protein